MNKSVVLIGVGGIGYRHFQSLLNYESKLDISVIDLDGNALEQAKRYELEKKNNNINVEYYKSISNIPHKISIAIIATSSLVRRKVFEELLEVAEIKFIVFEKFLFPKVEDYEYVKNKLSERGIKAYVNCPCRMYPGYIDLKKEIKNEGHLDVLVSGSNWGIACNAIHTIDVVGFLVDSYGKLFTDSFLLDDEIQDSKRKGYVDFTGRLVCQLSDKANIVFDSEKSGDACCKIAIYTKNKIYTISETEQTIAVFEDGKIEKKPFPILFQSCLTEKIVYELLNTRSCSLTRFENSMQWHVSLLEAFQKKYSSIQGVQKDICPIT